MQTKYFPIKHIEVNVINMTITITYDSLIQIFFFLISITNVLCNYRIIIRIINLI